MRFYTSILLVTFFACNKKDYKPDPTTRDIAGTVQVFNEFGVASNDVIGVTVTLSNDSMELTTQTIQGGKYSFSQVPFGKYNLAVSRTGFGTNKRFGIRSVKTVDSASYPLQLSPIGITGKCTTTMTSFRAAGKPNGSFDYWLGISPATGQGTSPRYFRIFIGTDSLVAWDNTEWIAPAFPVTGTGQSGTFGAGALRREYFPVGSKAWIRIYGDASPNNMYFDSTQKKFVFPCMNLNTQPASSFIVQ